MGIEETMEPPPTLRAPWIDAVQVPLAVIDVAGRVLAVNRAAQSWAARPAADWLGRPLGSLAEVPGGRLRWSFAPMPGEAGGLRLATGILEPRADLLETRLRQVRCLRQMTQVLAQLELTATELFEQTAESLRQAWQYPEIAAVRFEMAEQVWESPNWRATEWRQRAEIVGPGGTCGHLELAYLEPRPVAEQGPFLAAEQELLDDVGRRLGAWSASWRLQRLFEEAQEQLDTLLSLTESVVLRIDPDGKLLRVSNSAAQLFGQPADALLGTALYDHLVPEDRLAAATTVRQWLAERCGGGTMVNRLVAGDGGLREMHWSVQARYRPDGEVVSLWAVGRDCTAGNRAEEVQGRLAAALDAAAEAVWICDLDGAIRYTNPAFVSITGYRSDEAIGQNPRLLKSARQDEAFYAEMWRCMTSGEPWTGRIVNRRKDGETYTAQMTIAPVRDASGQVVEYIATQQDISAEVALQDRVSRAATLEAIGRLAAGISHDFNNILLAVMGYTELVMLDLGVDHPAYDSLSEVVSAADRGAALVRQMMAFSRQQPGETEAVDVNETVDDVRRLLRRMIGEDIAVRTDLAPRPLPILADAVRLHQVLINLAINARDAMPQGGELIFETALAPAGEPSPPLDDAGQSVRITVRDTGCGMTEDVRSRIFEPFFTTKQLAGGTGLGLATAHGIVSQLGGRIAVQSEPEQGTAFTIWLPLAAEAVDEAAAAATDATPAGRGETILLVEDEASLRELLGRALTNHGYRVILAADGREALEQMRLHDGDIDALLTDVIMPGMSGFELLNEIAQTYPDTKCLAMSGYADERLMQLGEARLIDRVERLSKPFSPFWMLRRMRELLDHAPPIGELLE